VRIDQVLRSNAPVFSFEFFPPKTPQGVDQLLHTIDELKPLAPSFVSVTYGAMGSNRGQVIELVSLIKHQIKLNPMAHLSCTGHTRDDLAAILDELAREEIENVLALRGDPPKGEEFRAVPGGFAHASDLAATDLRNLQTKVRAGVDFLITQLFFSNRDYFAFVERARAIGVALPIIPGIMPITDLAQIKRFTSMCGAKLPADLLARLEAADGRAGAVLAIGVEHAIEQCRELLRGGAPGVHFYTLNKSPATRQVLSALREELARP